MPLSQCPYDQTPGNFKHVQNHQEGLLWPNMKQDIEQYVKGCAACQANKANTRPLKPAMMLITPQHHLPFQTVAMDFITKLPQSGKYDTILTITDHDCSKAAIFIPCQETIMQKEWQPYTCNMCSHAMVSPKKLSWTEIPNSPPNSPKDFANP